MASARRSERTKKTSTAKAASKADRSSDPLRPDDHIDAAPPEAGVTQPRLGVVGYVRFFWRQLTS
ncbi:MAG TPA: cytochrome c biogenesis protein ResB, partial [Protaetiibacter sp.]|nr:cytochrome c biogenesis protein ResB [Protaetiibacter sp.]